MSDSNEKPLVLCLVGTDHHPFDRLVGWCDHLASARPDVHVLVQHGRTTAPRVADGVDFLDKDTLSSSLARAHVAITHGGPGLVSDVKAAGLAPLVLARNPDLGEHVDGHQMRFVARIARSGIVTSLTSEDELVAAVGAQLAAPRGEGVDPRDDEARVATSVANFAALVDPLVLARRR